MTSCEDLYRARIQANIEGDYTTWTEEAWSPVTANSGAFGGMWGVFDESGQKFYNYNNVNHVIIIDLTNGNQIDTNLAMCDWYCDAHSLLGKYVMLGGTGGTKIYKNGVLIQTLVLGFSVHSIGGPYMSPTGKWIVYLDTNDKLHFFKGSST